MPLGFAQLCIIKSSQIQYIHTLSRNQEAARQCTRIKKSSNLKGQVHFIVLLYCKEIIFPQKHTATHPLSILWWKATKKSTFSNSVLEPQAKFTLYKRYIIQIYTWHYCIVHFDSQLGENASSVPENNRASYSKYLLMMDSRVRAFQSAGNNHKLGRGQ